jgi:hypothetical protein
VQAGESELRRIILRGIKRTLHIQESEQWFRPSAVARFGKAQGALHLGSPIGIGFDIICIH